MTDKGKIGWGIVGLGRIADTTMAPAIAAVDEAELVAVASRDQGRADDFAKRHGARTGYASFEKLIADPDVDVVLITTPNVQHADQVVAAAQAGKHVLCDKPLATDPEDGLRAVRACEESGVTLGINFQTRHFSAFQAVREAISSGRLGEILIIQMEMSSGDTPLVSWRAEPSLAGLGTTYNIGVHGLDVMRYLLDDDVEEAVMLTDAGRSGKLERIALTTLRFRKGALAYLNANQRVPMHRPDFAVYGTRGRALGRNVTRPWCSGMVEIATEGEPERVERHSNDDAYEKVVADFCRAVRTGGSPLATGEDGLASVLLTAALARSAGEGLVVKPEEAPARA